MTQQILALNSYLLNNPIIEGLFDFFSLLNASLERRKQINITIEELSNLTDKELNDIGITRSDIRVIARKENM